MTTTENKREFWQRHITQWKQSKLTQPQYCQEHHLKLSSFGYWRTQLNKNNRPTSQPAKLIPVKVTASANARFLFPNGTKLEIPVGALPEVLPLLMIDAEFRDHVAPK